MWLPRGSTNMVYSRNRSNHLPYIYRIKQFELVIEYTGELIRNSLADERERSYVEKGFGDCYMFRASKEKVIDATFLGSQARYLNHSCDVSKYIKYTSPA